MADQIQYIVSDLINKKLRDPQIGFVTLTNVKLSKDLRIASIYFTALGNKDNALEPLETLNRAKSFIRSEVAHLMKVRFVPEIRFFIDDTLEYASRIDEILKDIKKHEDEK